MNKQEVSSPQESQSSSQNYSQIARSNPAMANAGFAELDEDDDDEGEGQIATGDKRRFFTKELKFLLYGYGDDPNPFTETVEALEDFVIEFITDMALRAMDIGRPGRVQVEDIIYLIRNQPRMYARVKDLLTMNEELKKARKAFDEVKLSQAMG